MALSKSKGSQRFQLIEFISIYRQAKREKEAFTCIYGIKEGDIESEEVKNYRGIIKDKVGIEQRPMIVEERKRFDDFEVDLIIGKNHNQAMITINDRASGMLKITKIASKEAKVVSKAIVEELTDWIP